MKQFRLRQLGPFIGLILFLISLWVLKRILGENSYRDIFEFLAVFPIQRIWGAVGLTMASYGLLTCYDHLALRYLNQRLGPMRVSLASFINYCFSRNMGFALLTGGSIRYRYYSAWGLSAEEIARLISFAAGTFVLGVMTMGGSLLLSTSKTSPHWPVPVWTLNLVGLLALGLTLGYLLWVKAREQPLLIRGWEIPLPSLGQSLAQVVLGSLDWTLKAGILYYLVSAIASISLLGFLEIYLLAQILATISHVPGGLGVFEAAVVAMVPEVASADMLAILLVYRGIYFLLPFGLAILLLGVLETLQHAKAFPNIKTYFGGWLSSLAPPLYAAVVVISGALLIFSCATPTITERLQRLGEAVPLFLIEMGHLGLAVIGAGFLLLARGILRRLQKAYLVTTLLLAVAAGLTLLKGLTYEQAILLVLILVSMIPGRDLFHRPTSLREESFPGGWLTIIFIVSGAGLWLVSISYGAETLTLSRFGSFDLYDDAARSLRAMAGANIVLVVFLIVKRRSTFTKTIQPPGEQEMQTARQIMVRQPAAVANLASFSNKKLLIAEARDAVLPYIATEQFWIALDGPFGDARRNAELAWCFRKMCDHAGVLPVFYLVRESFLPVCLEMGMTFMKMGDEIAVPLEAGDVLDGSPDGAGCKKDMFTFEISMITDHRQTTKLQEVCAQWGGFLVFGEGEAFQDTFNWGYPKRFSLAIVSCRQRPAAFALVLPGRDKKEFTIDLLHFSPEFGPNAAYCLVDKLMVWGGHSGFANFSIGIFPSLQSGQRKPEGPWHLLGPSAFRNGQSFSSCRQMSNFAAHLPGKASPRYVAFPGESSLQKVFGEIKPLLWATKFSHTKKKEAAVSSPVQYCDRD